MAPEMIFGLPLKGPEEMTYYSQLPGGSAFIFRGWAGKQIAPTAMCRAVLPLMETGADIHGDRRL